MPSLVLQSVGSSAGCSCATATVTKVVSEERSSGGGLLSKKNIVRAFHDEELCRSWRRSQRRSERHHMLRSFDDRANFKPRGMMREREKLAYEGHQEKLIEVASDYEAVGLSTNTNYLSSGRPESAEDEASSRSEDRHQPNIVPEDTFRTKDKLGNGEEHRDDAASTSISGEMPVGGSVVVAALVVAGLAGVTGAGFLFKDQLHNLIEHLNDYIEGHGSSGYIVFILVYAGLEILGIPAIPITMTAGLLFGNVVGTILVSIAGTLAATCAFLIARYLMRDRILEMAKGNKQFLAIDRAIRKDSFRVVTLLRLSPLLPFSLGNYLYGLTSVELVPYILGSWLGMLPGSFAYVNAGSLGRSFLETGGENVAGPSPWVLTGGIGLTILAGSYITKLAKEALEESEEE